MDDYEIKNINEENKKRLDRLLNEMLNNEDKIKCIKQEIKTNASYKRKARSLSREDKIKRNKGLTMEQIWAKIPKGFKGDKFAWAAF